MTIHHCVAVEVCVTRKYREWIAGRSMTVSCPRPSPEAYPVRGLLKYCGDCVWAPVLHELAQRRGNLRGQQPFCNPTGCVLV